MSATLGIASFVDGFVRGREVKNSWEDRKLDRERQKRLDELTIARDKRDAEEHGARMGALRRSEADWNRENDQRTAWEKANQDAVDATNAAIAADQNSGEDTTVSTSGSSPGVSPDAAAQIGQNLGLPVQSISGSMVSAIDASGGIAPKSDLGAIARANQPGPTVAAAAAPPVQTSAPPPPRVSYEQWRAMSRGERQKAGLPVSEIGGQLHFNRFGVGAGWNEPTYGDPVVDPLGIMPNYDHQWGTSAGGDAAEAGRRALSGIGAVEGGVADVARRGAQQAANAVNGVINPVTQYVTGGAAPEIPMFTGNGWVAKPPSQVEAEASKQTLAAGLRDLSQTWKAATDGPKGDAADSIECASIRKTFGKDAGRNRNKRDGCDSYARNAGGDRSGASRSKEHHRQGSTPQRQGNRQTARTGGEVLHGSLPRGRRPDRNGGHA